MRVTIAGYGSEGDVRPAVALAVGLKAAGHDPVVVGGASGASLSASVGVEFVPLAPLENAVPSLLAGLRQRWPHREWLATILEAAAGSDVVVGLPAVSYHAAAAAEQVGAIGVLAGLQPMQPTRDFLPAAVGTRNAPEWLNLPVGRLVDSLGWSLIGGGVNRVRRESGLPALRNPFHALPILGAWSPTLVPTPADWPSGMTVTGQWQLPADPTWTPDPDLASFLAEGDRPIYVGFGSMTGPRVDYAVEQILAAFGADYRLLLAVGHDDHREGQVGSGGRVDGPASPRPPEGSSDRGEAFEGSVQGEDSARPECRGMGSVHPEGSAGSDGRQADSAGPDGRQADSAGSHGRQTDSAGPGPGRALPENVRRIGHVPHEWLFPRCGVIVHHAGAGTAHAAARAGVPSLPVPYVLDQPFWADRLYRAGIATQPVDPRSGWEAYKAALRTTVPLRDRAQELASTVSAETGVARAVEALESLAHSRRR